MMKFLYFLVILVVYKNAYPQYKIIENAGVQVNYRIFGQGSPILIIGGGPGDNSDRYVGLCELLSKDFQCILVDQRGTGKSMPEKLDSTTITISLTLTDFETIRKKNGLNEWSVLGFSYGGYLASLYVHFYPTSVANLVLMGSIGLNTDVFEYSGDNVTSRLCTSDLDKFAFWSDSARNAQDPHHALLERIRARMPGYFFSREKSLLISQNMKDSDFNFYLGRWIWSDIAKRDLNLLKTESNFFNPVLILHGRQDPVGELVPVEISRYYKKSKLVFIEKCGHYSWVEQPDTVLSKIRFFLKSNSK